MQEVANCTRAASFGAARSVGRRSNRTTVRPPATRVDVMTAAAGQKSQIYTAPVRVRGRLRRRATRQKSVDAPFNYRCGRGPAGSRPARPATGPPPAVRPSSRRTKTKTNSGSEQTNCHSSFLPSFLSSSLAPSSSSSFPRPRPSVPSCLPSFIKGEVIPSPKLFLRPPQLLREAPVEAAAGWKVRPVRVNRGGFFK